MKWKDYETQVYEYFREKYGEGVEVLADQKLRGRHSHSARQVDLVVKGRLADVEVLAVFDCKCFARRVDVKTVDGMVGLIDDVKATCGGIITTIGFTRAAVNRARAANIDVRTIELKRVEPAIEVMFLGADFSDERNSALISVLF